MISLVTGVGKKGQVGEAVAAALASRGDTVLLVSRSAAEVEARAADLVAAGYTARGYACDLSDIAAVDRLVQQMRSAHGDRLDALVNLAGGFAMSGPLADSSPDVVDQMLRINFLTAYNATRALLPLVRSASGSVVFFASDVVLEGSRSGGVAAYASAKAAVVALMRSLADQGRELGVRSNALAPSSIRTASNEAAMGADTPYVEREDVASAVAFLCSPASRAITGQLIRLRPRP